MPDNDEHQGKVAFITGGGRGFGKAFGAALSARGAHVVLADIDGTAAEAAAAELTAVGGSVTGVTCDVADETAVQAVVDKVAQQHGGLDILVNNAGLHAAYNKPFTELGLTKVRRVLSPQVDHTLVGMLKGVIDTAAGTGQLAAVPGYSVAGKTGTAQKALAHGLGYSTRNYVASFVGFLPADHPQVEVLVVVDSPRTNIFGGIVAAPAFQQIATFLTKDLAIPPDRPLN
jgi:NAD(P)-dependent dehydrogenase (short-subunit alcohol dehydrogenase family)